MSTTSAPGIFSEHGLIRRRLRRRRAVRTGHWPSCGTGKTPHGTRKVARLILSAVTNKKQGPLAFGEFITSVYDARGEEKARRLVQLAVNARQVEFRGRDRFVILEPGSCEKLSSP